MRTNHNSQSRISNPLVILGFALGLAGTFLAMLGFAAPSSSEGPYPRPGHTERISFAGTVEADGDSARPSVSADGRFIAFESGANNLFPGDANEKPDVFVYDRKTAAMVRVSEGADGTPGND